MDTNRQTDSHEESAATDVSNQQLLDDDLDDVAGGGIVKDTYEVLENSWSDIKQGISDAFSD